MAILGGMAFAAPAMAQNEQFIPHLVYRTGAYAPNGIPFANGVADYYRLVNARDGGINGVKIVFEECDTDYATDRGVECYERLKGKGPTGRGLCSSALDRHHVRADRKGADRQDPDHLDGLWPLRFARRLGVPVELPAARHLLDRGRHPAPAHRQEGRRLRQAQGQEDRARLSRLALRQGADRAAAEARADARLRTDAAAGDASRRRAEGDLAANPPEPARLRAALGLGRDELHRDQGSGRGRLSAREDVRRVVVGRRARRAAGRGRRQGLQRGDAAARRRPLQAARRSQEVRVRQGQGHGEMGRDRRNSLRPRPHQRHARRRGDPHRAGRSTATSR